MRCGPRHVEAKSTIDPTGVLRKYALPHGVYSTLAKRGAGRPRISWETPPSVPFVEEEAMELPEQTIDDLLKRLRRVEGQVRGIQQMLLDGRECRDIVTQISAASKAIDQAGFKLVASGLTYCLNDPDRAALEGYGVDDVQKMFMKLA